MCGVIGSRTWSPVSMPAAAGIGETQCPADDPGVQIASSRPTRSPSATSRVGCDDLPVSEETCVLAVARNEPVAHEPLVRRALVLAVARREVLRERPVACVHQQLRHARPAQRRGQSVMVEVVVRDQDPAQVREPPARRCASPDSSAANTSSAFQPQSTSVKPVVVVDARSR